MRQAAAEGPTEVKLCAILPAPEDAGQVDQKALIGAVAAVEQRHLL